MGLWAKGTHRKLRLQEFRIEVVFETPVIFTAPPTNKRGPIKDREIYYIDGTQQSYEKTRVLGPDAQRAAVAEAAARVHTADDERASWVTLLSTLQHKEEQSRKWDLEMRCKAPPRGSLPAKVQEYELAVGLQSKTRSWDFIPSSITKPYATSAICHLVEMMAMLGLYWKVFDQSVWNLRAEGNGFILTSTTVHGLGVMVVFAITGKSNFTGNRVIPCHALKELSFGTVPNIFDDKSYLESQTDAQSVELVFGTSDEVSDTLEAIGLQAEALKRYKKDHKHIFSRTWVLKICRNNGTNQKILVSFELIGMLGKVFRIRGSSFKMLPNPTGDPWLKNIGQKASWKITRLMDVFQDKLGEYLEAEGYKLLDTHQISIIISQWKKITGLGCVDDANMSLEVREAIHDAIDQSTEFLLTREQSAVLTVLVAHLTKVLEVLDDPNSPLNTIVLANKEEAFLRYYIHKILPEVAGSSDDPDKRPSREDKVERTTIWVSLIFRMLCWLLLHDFDKADIKIVPSDLKGSRMPVYIG